MVFFADLKKREGGLLSRARLYDTIRSNQGEVAPYKFLTPVVTKMKEYVAGKLKVFANIA